MLDHIGLATLHDLVGIATRAIHTSVTGGGTRGIDDLLDTEIMAEGINGIRLRFAASGACIMLLAGGKARRSLALGLGPAVARSRGLVIGVGVRAARTSISCPAARGTAGRYHCGGVTVAESIDGFRLGFTTDGTLIALNAGNDTRRIVACSLLPCMLDHIGLATLHDLIGITTRAIHTSMTL